MRMGKVVNTIVSTRKNERLVGSKILEVRLMENGRDTDEYLVAIDTVGAGIGEPVLIATTSVIAAPVSPRRMIDPLPNSFSIWLIAISRLLSLLILFLASLSAMILTPVLFD